ncbi:MAG: hypothetical protein KJ767_03050 [Nanoarchaeota archaeon]|nr:hypothetical protein [Nanoarchaeota archaeon]
MENLEEKALEGEEIKEVISKEQEREEILYKGQYKVRLQEYLDSDPKYHNWSRSCDVGH